MKIGIIGVKGMLGSELARRAVELGHKVCGYDLPEIDITRSLPAGRIESKCDAIVNCAAYTDVDGAESSSDLAYAINDDGAGRIAKWCSVTRTRLVHISTDYVFDGELGRAYTEEDDASPVSVYGMSKLAGELSVLEVKPDALIVRTQALFGPGGKSFPAAIMGKIEGGERKLRVVDDQTVSPTCTGHLAEAIIDLLGTGCSHLLHVSSSGKCTWYEFACEIVKRLSVDVVVEPVSTAAFPRPARRPKFSVLDKGRFEKIAGRRMPDWHDALSWYLERR